MSDDAREREDRERILRGQRDEEEEDKKKHSTTPNAGLDTIVQSEDDKDDIIAAYNARFGGKPGFVQPVRNEDGSVSLSFPEKGDAESFFMDQAAKGRKMIIIDGETGTIMAYSNGGDGTLYHADGKPFEKGDELKPSTIKKEDFTLPEPPRNRM